MKKKSMVSLIAFALVVMVSVGAFASNTQERVETQTKTLQAENSECTGEELQVRTMVQRQLRQSLGENGQHQMRQVQKQRFGRR